MSSPLIILIIILNIESLISTTLENYTREMEIHIFFFINDNFHIIPIITFQYIIILKKENSHYINC